jgi:hypothetical protein
MVLVVSTNCALEQLATQLCGVVVRSLAAVAQVATQLLGVVVLSWRVFAGQLLTQVTGEEVVS